MMLNHLYIQRNTHYDQVMNPHYITQISYEINDQPPQSVWHKLFQRPPKLARDRANLDVKPSRGEALEFLKNGHFEWDGNAQHYCAYDANSNE